MICIYVVETVRRMIAATSSKSRVDIEAFLGLIYHLRIYELTLTQF